MNKDIIQELEKIDSDNKDVIKSPDDVKNDFHKIRNIRTPLFWFTFISLGITLVITILEIPLLVALPDIQGGSKDANGTISGGHPIGAIVKFVVTLVIMLWTFVLYVLLTTKGVSAIEYNDVFYYGGRATRRVHEIRHINYRIATLSLFVLIADFLLFYGADMNLITGDTYHYFKAWVPLMAAISIVMPAIVIPMAINFMNRYFAYINRTKRFDKWIEMNGISKVNYIDKIDYASEDFNWKDVSDALELETDVLIFDTSSENRSKEQIDLFNKVKVEIIKQLLAEFNSNTDKKYQYYKQLTTRRDRFGRLYIKKTIKNQTNITRIRRLNQKNNLLSDIMIPYFK